MPNTLRSSTIRLAASLPVGSPGRKALLHVLTTQDFSDRDLERIRDFKDAVLVKWDTKWTPLINQARRYFRNDPEKAKGILLQLVEIAEPYLGQGAALGRTFGQTKWSQPPQQDAVHKTRQLVEQAFVPGTTLKARADAVRAVEGELRQLLAWSSAWVQTTLAV